MTLRSGKEFSPWDAGQPIQAPDSFHLSELLAVAYALEDMEFGTDFEQHNKKNITTGSSAPLHSPSSDTTAQHRTNPSALHKASIPSYPTSTDTSTLNCLNPPALQSSESVLDVSNPPTKHKLKKMSHSHFKRKEKRRVQTEEDRMRSRGAYNGPLKKTLQQMDPLHVDFSCKKLKAAQGGHIGLRQKKEYKLYNLDHFCERGFEIIEWDGITPRPLVDKKGRIFAVLAGRPNIKDDPKEWDKVIREAAKEMCDAEEDLTFDAKEANHRRGPFPVKDIGISMGGGQKQPTKRAQSEKNWERLRRLINTGPLKRISGFANASFRNWAPKLYEEYRQNLTVVYDKFPDEDPLFPGTIFANVTTNHGKKIQVATYPHVDHLNVPYGLCGVTSMGDFDHTKGGHLVLWDLEIVIQFPSGSTILLPSSTLRHSNVSLQEGETRHSITFYTAGGLFRWVKYGCRTEEQLREQDPEEWKRVEAVRHERGRDALKYFSTLDELRAKVLK